MTTPIAVHKPAGGPPPQASGGGLSGLKKRRVMVAAAAAGLVALLALVRGHGSASDAGTGAPGTPGTSTYDSSASDAYNSIQPEIDALTKQIEDLQSKFTTPAPPPVKTTLPAMIDARPIATPHPRVSRPPLAWRRPQLPVTPVRGL